MASQRTSTGLILRFLTSAVCTLILADWAVAAEQGGLRVRLKNGDFITGSLVASEKPEQAAIVNPAFVSPIEFHVDALASVESGQPVAEALKDEWLFVLNNHTRIYGKLQQLNQDNVTVVSRSLGKLTFPRSLLSEMSSNSGAGKLLFVGPRAGQEWQAQPLKDAWTIEAGSLTTTSNCPVECDVKLSEKCELRLGLSWTKTPDFVIHIGLGKHQPGPNRTQCNVRLETWKQTLVMVRETQDDFDFVSLEDLTPDGKLNLVLHIDQAEGVCLAHSPTGKELGRLQVADKKRLEPSSRIRLMNASTQQGTFRLDRLDVRQWSGKLTSTLDSDGVVTQSGQVTQGQVTEFDPTASTLGILREDQTQTTIELQSISRVAFGNRVSEPPASELLEIQFADQSTCVGAWKNSTNGQLTLQVPDFPEPLAVPLDQITGLSGNSLKHTAGVAAARSGYLENPTLRLHGSLSDSTKPGELIWQASSTTLPVTLHPNFVGKVEYRVAVNAAPNASTAQANRRARPANVAPNGILLRGVARPAQVHTQGPQATLRVLELGLKFRSGDSVEAQVQQIDERGVTFQLGTETKVIPHDKLESVTLTNEGRSTVPEPGSDKLKQLLTVPRAAKADPPTHLFVGRNGDYLRGRLVSYKDNRVTAEIRLENVTFPEGAIIQIYWLHSRDWDNADTADQKTKEAVPDGNSLDADPPAAAELQVHAIQKQGRSITFTPTETRLDSSGTLPEQILKGQNDLLGACEVTISNLDVLLVGKDVGKQARELQKDAWKLSVAPEPRVYQEGENASESASPLVGKPAPDFDLETLDGSKLSLSKLRGRVTILDFWASWCGPCMKTMPEVDRIINEIGTDKVELVAINLQETKERAAAAAERLQLTATVVLDTEGKTALKYQANAIPQTVIVDANGNVTHVFVGGGQQFLEQFQAALKSVLTAQ